MAYFRSVPFLGLLALAGSAALAQPPASMGRSASHLAGPNTSMMAFQYNGGRAATPGEDIYERAAHRHRLVGIQAALPLYEEAAAAGSPQAMRELGFFYVRRGDLAHGLDSLYEAARRGDPGAMLALASAFRHGEGVDRDDQLARFWLVRAADSGYRPAMEARRRLATASR